MRADAEAARAAIESSEAHNSSELAPVAESVLPTTVAEHLGKNEPLPVVERTEEVMNTPEQLKQTKPDKEVEVAQKHSVARRLDELSRMNSPKKSDRNILQDTLRNCGLAQVQGPLWRPRLRNLGLTPHFLKRGLNPESLQLTLIHLKR